MDSRALEPFCPYPAGLIRLYRHPSYWERGDFSHPDHKSRECCGAAEEDSRERVLPRDGPVRLEGPGPRLGEAERRLAGKDYRIELNFPGLVVS